MNTLISALRSKTVWLGIIVTFLPIAEQLTGPITGLNPVAGGILGAAIMVLRALTVKPLSSK